jgi:hypothetical protein
MAWKKMFGADDEKKENEVPNDAEKKVDANKPPEKTPAELIADALKPVTEGFASMRAEIDELKVKTAPKGHAEIPSVLDDEDGAFNTRLTPIMAKTLEMEARMAKDDVEKEYRQLGFGDLWDENRKEIDTFLAKTQLVAPDEKGQPAALRGNPEYIRNVADMMIGKAVKKGGVKFDGKDKRFFLEDTTGDGTIITRKVAENEGITKKQLAAAARFGIPIADYKKAAGKLNFVDN